jgi:hypothetical protein
MPDIDTEDQTAKQKKMLFANSEHIATVVMILQECVKREKLIGDTEFSTIVNAVTLDAQSQLIIDFINTLDRIRSGSLHVT